MKKLLLLVSVLLFSQNLFSQVTLLTPNGGEVWVAGSTQTVSWTDTNPTGYVNLDYSSDNGGTWYRFANSASSMYPTYQWGVPSLMGTFYKVRVTDVNNSLNFDESNAPFTITDKLPSTLTLTYPNGGEIFYNGSPQTITWNSSNVGAVNLYFSPDNGSTWNSIATNLPAYMGSYSSIVTSASTNNALIRISDASDAATFDECDRVFTIIDTTKNIITLSLPNGGENWQVGTNQYIAWTNTKMNGTVNIDYTTNNGLSWFTVASNLPSMYPTYMWTVPNSPSTSCKIKVYDASDASVFDESDAVFTIQRLEQFTEQTSISLLGLGLSSVAWGDYDNDGYLDILLTGRNDASHPFTIIYKNNGDGTFTEQSNAALTSASSGSAAWGDYDNDGYLDILLTGYTPSGPVSQIYKNNGDGTFTLLTSVSLPGVGNSSVAWGDYDNDGKLDFLLTGNSFGARISKIYKNNGNGIFTEQTSVSLTGVYNSSVAWGDYDNDGNLDILLTGLNDASGQVSIIYKNNGDGTFTELTFVFLAGVEQGSVAWGDYDNDGYLDILLTGINGTNQISKIYKNTGAGTFTEQKSASLTGVSNSSVAWGDYNNDGLPDILLTGYEMNNNPISKIYKNMGEGIFYEQTSVSLIGVGNSSAVWGDYDNDGTLDILLTGYTTGSGYVSKIYKNNISTFNTVATAPTNLTSSVSGNDVSFNWNKSFDEQTPQNGLSYNLLIGTTLESADVLSPMANKTNGFRRIVKQGNNQTNSWTIKNLPGGTYLWSVQAIDAAFKGSPFASQEVFRVGEITDTLLLLSPNGGENLVSGTVDTIHWSANYLTQVKLDYTTDYGATWTNIVGSMPAEYPSGYAWVVPNTPSQGCKIRVTDINNNGIFDESDGIFSIQLFKSGEYLPDANTVMLDHFNGTTDASILAYTQTGQTCGSELPPATPSFYFSQGLNEFYQALTLNPPFETAQGSATYLKYPGGQLLSRSNGTIEFWIHLSSYGKGLSFVNQGQFFGACAGWTFNLDMDSTGMLNSSAWVAFNLNSGTNKVPIGRWTHVAVSWGSMGAKLYIDGNLVGSDANTGMPADGYGGNVLIALGTGAGVSSTIDELRISDIQRTEFNIIPQQTFALVSPNGGENFVAGEVDTIRWTSSNANILNIEYSTDNGINWISIYPAMPASVGSAPWLVPNTPSTSCKVRIADAANPIIFDESDGAFTINSGGGNDSIMYGDKIYHTVKIGTQTWLKENLDVGVYVASTETGSIHSDVADNGIIEKYCFDNNTANCATYGGLYDWKEAMAYSTTPGTKGICPTGWHIPTQAEFETLKAAVGNDGNKLKREDQGTGSGVGTNTSGFSALLAGARGFTGGFGSLGLTIFFWSSTEYDAASADYVDLYAGDSGIFVGASNYKEYGFSIRCLKDENTTASIQITSPNGGEVFHPDTQIPIEWNATGVQSFTIEFTTDNGSNWIPITENYMNEYNGFLWYIPQVETDIAKIRISDASNPGVFDESDSSFTISNKIIQSIRLWYSGWNMISFYVQPQSSLPRDVFPSPLVLQVKTELQSFDPALPEFLNTLKSINASQGYLVKTDFAEHSFPVIGTHFYPADGINYRAGWNLMSYYYSYGESIWYAFEPIMTSVEEVKTLTGYFNPLGSTETNTLYSLEPGEAYWFKLKNTIDGYILPSPQTIMPKKHQTTGQKLMADLPWKLKGYPQSTVAIFTVTSDGKPVSAGSVVAAFVNNECRAISEVKLNSEGTAFATLVINGDKEEEVSFKIFDAVKKEAFGSNLKIKTKPGTTIAGIQELPFTFVTGIEDPILPTTTTLMNAYPNPFNPETRIRYSLNMDQHVSLKIYDVLGKEVITLVDDTKNAGYYEVSFDASGLPSGIYFYRMQSGEYVSVKKLLLLK